MNFFTQSSCWRWYLSALATVRPSTKSSLMRSISSFVATWRGWDSLVLPLAVFSKTTCRYCSGNVLEFSGDCEMCVFDFAAHNHRGFAHICPLKCTGGSAGINIYMGVCSFKLLMLVGEKNSNYVRETEGFHVFGMMSTHSSLSEETFWYMRCVYRLKRPSV